MKQDDTRILVKQLQIKGGVDAQYQLADIIKSLQEIEADHFEVSWDRGAGTSGNFFNTRLGKGEWCTVNFYKNLTEEEIRNNRIKALEVERNKIDVEIEELKTS